MPLVMSSALTLAGGRGSEGGMRVRASHTREYRLVRLTTVIRILYLSRVVWDYSVNNISGGNDTSKAKYWYLKK